MVYLCLASNWQSSSPSAWLYNQDIFDHTLAGPFHPSQCAKGAGELFCDLDLSVSLLCTFEIDPADFLRPAMT
jgi:hypothetical protein